MMMFRFKHKVIMRESDAKHVACFHIAGAKICEYISGATQN